MTGDWKNCRRLSGIGLCVLFSASAAAQLLPPDMLEDDQLDAETEVVHRFSVEVIVFEYGSNVALGSETFALKQTPPSLEPETPVVTDATGNSPVSTVDNPAIVADGVVEASLIEDLEVEEIPTLAGIDFKLLDAEEMTMGEIHERLMQLDSYQPVLWGGWTQTTEERGVSPPIRLRLLGSPPIYLHGKFTLYLKNYLHLVVDLTRESQTTMALGIKQLPIPAYGDFGDRNSSLFEAVDTQTIQYQIKEDRIFRSGQLRYYDHPKFGVLARVNRVEADLPDNDVDDDEALPRPTMVSKNKAD